MTLADGTEVVHSEIIKVNSIEVVDVYFERPDTKYGFCTANCRLPQKEWTKVHGFSKEDCQFLTKFINNNFSIIYDMAKIGGFKNA